eukprot:5624587-Pleurochrysis_carterae.AAC.4
MVHASQEMSNVGKVEGAHKGQEQTSAAKQQIFIVQQKATRKPRKLPEKDRNLDNNQVLSCDSLVSLEAHALPKLEVRL